MAPALFNLLRGAPSKGRGRADAAASVLNVEGYEIELRRATRPNGDLVVMFSPGRRFALYKHDFGCDALFVADPALRYYLRDVPKLADAVIRVVERGSYRRVLFVGSSKGGFGALSVAKLCARLRPEQLFHVVAFSPQVQLFPENPSLYFKSYKALLRRAALQPRLKRALRRFGDVSDVGDERNLVIEIIYASAAKADRDEARRISGAQVGHRVVAGATHGTAFHFMCHGLRRAQIRARIKLAYRRRGDKDLRQTRPTDLPALIDEIMASALNEPTLNDLFAQVMSREAPMLEFGRPKAPTRAFGFLAGLVEKRLRLVLGKS